MESLSQRNRIKFKTTQDWHNFIKQPNIQFNPLELRKSCYKDIEQYRKRPLLVYATKFLEGISPGVPNFIDLPDVDGFTDLIDSVKNNSDAVDVLLHSPGGKA